MAGWLIDGAHEAHAQALMQAFADHPGAGVVALDGAMLDRPHLALAQRLLAEAELSG